MATSGGRSGSQAVPRLLALAGDLAIFLLFAAIGRHSHGERSGILQVGETALPFIIGWLAAALALGAYTSAAFLSAGIAARRAVITAVGGVIIALVLRSIAEHRLVPIGFAAVALVFNLPLLVIWRVLLAALMGRGYRPWARS